MPTLYVESSQITYCDYTYIYISFLHPYMKSIGVTHETIFVMLIAFVSWIPRPQMEKRANKWATPSMDSRTHFPSWSWGYLSSCRCRAIIFSVNDKHCSFFSFFFFPFYASLHMLVRWLNCYAFYQIYGISYIGTVSRHRGFLLTGIAYSQLALHLRGSSPLLWKEYFRSLMSIKHLPVWSCSRPKNLSISLFVGSRAESGASGFKLARSTTTTDRA